MKGSGDSSKPTKQRVLPEAQPHSGAAAPGKPFDPASATGDRESLERSGRPPRAAPAPGVPVSHAEYERLKQKAKFRRTPPTEDVQEDPAESE
jgi:hypothetical protein